MWDLIVSVPDHCLSFYFTVRPLASHLYRKTSNCEAFLYSVCLVSGCNALHMLLLLT